MPALTTGLLESIASLPSDWHGCGTMPANVLAAIERHCGHVRRSVETGAGKTTLLLSHLSEHHTVFAIDLANSVNVTQGSDLLNRGTVEFVEGPTQRTVPAYEFTAPLDFVLIDGPHGYPFPELEYWALYRHIRSGGLLVIDDIHIPTIHNMFRFLCEEPMFRLVEVVGSTAFFRRTDAPTFDPYYDGWWEQPYNTARFPVDLTPLSAPTAPTIEDYRSRLLPLIERWRAQRLRIAVFGTGAHTEHLFAVVPELNTLQIIAFLESDPEKHETLFRTRPVQPPSWAEGNCDIVLCSSFAHEMSQMAVLDGCAVKVVPSHIGSTGTGRRA